MGLEEVKGKQKVLQESLKMIRRVQLNVGYANTGKLADLRQFSVEASKVINLYINTLWADKDFSSKYVTQKVDTWLSARMQQCLGKQALEIVKSQRKRKKKFKPVFRKQSFTLDSRFVDVQFGLNSFDVWVKIASIGNKMILNLPSKQHRQLHKYNNWKLRKSIRLRFSHDQYFIDLFYEKAELPKKKKGNALAIDIGYKKLIVTSDNKRYGDDAIYKKIARKKQGSKAFKRALIERDEAVNVACKSLNIDELKVLYAEDLKNVKKNSKGKIRKHFNNKLQRWVYPRVLEKLAMLCEEKGVELVKIPPAYTSQRCSNCGVICKSNRQGEAYKCACGNELDADYNAALNILHLGKYGAQAFKQVL